MLSVWFALSYLGGLFTLLCVHSKESIICQVNHKGSFKIVIFVETKKENPSTGRGQLIKAE